MGDRVWGGSRLAAVFVACCGVLGQTGPVTAQDVPVPDDSVHAVLDILIDAPGCTMPRTALVAALDRMPEAEVDRAVAYLEARALGVFMADSGKVTLGQGLCPSRGPKPGTMVQALIRLGSCAVTPTQLRDWMREFDLAPDVAAAALAARAAASEILVLGDDQFIGVAEGAGLNCNAAVAALVEREAEAIWQATATGCVHGLQMFEAQYAGKDMGGLYMGALLAAAVTRAPDAAGDYRTVDLTRRLMMTGSQACIAEGKVAVSWDDQETPRERFVKAVRAAGCVVDIGHVGTAEFAGQAGFADKGAVLDALMIAGAAGDLDPAAPAGQVWLSAVTCGGAAAVPDPVAPAARDAALKAFQQAEGCGVTVAALEEALGAAADAVVGGMIVAGEVTLDGGRLVLAPALCKPAPDLAKGRMEVVDAFASKACSMTPAEAEVSLAPDGAAALEAMLAAGEVQLVFGRLVMETAVCNADPGTEAPIQTEGALGTDAAGVVPAAAPEPMGPTPPQVAEGLRRATDLETAEAVLAALEAIGCSANLTETAELQAVFYPAFARAMGVPDDLIQHEAVRMAVIAAATRGADSLLRQKLVVYSDVSGWFGLASCKDQRPDPTSDQAKMFLKAMSRDRGDTFFAGVVRVLGCEMDFSDPEALVRVLVDAYAEALGQTGSADAELLALIDAEVGAALERASGALERVGVSSRFRMKDCAA